MEELLAEFAKRNIRVVFKELNFWSGLLFYLKEQNKWVCVVNSLNELSAQRWTLAHELAHFLLHPNCRYIFTDGIFFCGLNDMEWQANRMAGEMLIPKKSIQDMGDLNWLQNLEEIRLKIQEKSQKLEVPFRALAWWLFELGFLSYRIYNKLVLSAHN
ncbi:MAG: ImmA/IrrE family metallo-endopeptidase [Nitrososphaerota archaeon]